MKGGKITGNRFYYRTNKVVQSEKGGLQTHGPMNSGEYRVEYIVLSLLRKELTIEPNVKDLFDGLPTQTLLY